MTAAVDTAIRNGGDHDITLGVSDRVSFVGFQVPDKNNYLTL